MWRSLIVGVAALGTSALALSYLLGSRRTFRRGLIAGDSLVASPAFKQPLEQLTGIPWDSVAVVGANSATINRQVQQSLRPGEHDVLVISAGTNDGSGALSSTQRNLGAIVAQGRAAGAYVVLMTEPPLHAYRGANAAGVARSEASARWVRGGGARANRAVDLHRLLGDEGLRLKQEYDGGDGLHPNSAGRLAMAYAVARAMR